MDNAIVLKETWEPSITAGFTNVRNQIRAPDHLRIDVPVQPAWNILQAYCNQLGLVVEARGVKDATGEYVGLSVSYGNFVGCELAKVDSDLPLDDQQMYFRQWTERCCECLIATIAMLIRRAEPQPIQYGGNEKQK